MLITVNNEQLEINFNPSINVRVTGFDSLYYVEVREYLDNDSESKFVEGFHIDKNTQIVRSRDFNFYGEFYGDYEISIFKFVDSVGLQKIYSHRYNDYGKLVQFNLVTKEIDEAKIWIQSIHQYQKKHGCIVKINSSFEEINNSYPLKNITHPYKTYNIGRFPKTSTDFKTVEETRKYGNLWFGNWKVFWSYQHPRDWRELSAKEIADDILGL